MSPNVRSLVGFALLGCINAVLAPTVFSTNYLIIPYSRPIVIIIEGLPALAIKLLLPHVLYYVAWRTRPCLLAGCWLLAALVTLAAPPNVSPLIRILSTAIASATAAAGEVMFVTQTRHYGPWGLAGWGIGTGIGGLVAVMMPYVLTTGLRLFLRCAIQIVYPLVAIMLLAYFYILPAVQLPRVGGKRRQYNASSGDDEENIPLTTQEVTPPSTVKLADGIKGSLSLAKPLMAEYILPIALTFTLQSFVFPASARLQPRSTSIETFTQFKFAFGFAFQLGSLASRSSVWLFRWKSVYQLLLLTAVASGLQLINTVFMVSSNAISLLLLASSAGAASGAIYMKIWTAYMDHMGTIAMSDGDISVGCISTGETLGGMVGSLAGSFMELFYCGSEGGRKRRWCSSTR
ncbi:hypothetical protein QQS21_002269 [Conoideocrella luteorostrata]|uniref:Protein BTN n=1 Tax=Conoideocrella luteorostrata TaxID=1105319 RepID=A0AAJ0CVG1_9HYPO|nr:hypothetical protein QQS21_002269 [Conoideocrella luteorostrata]